MRHISSILVANRGEIALRIMRTARAMGYRSIAVYSDADSGAPHVAYADQSLPLGGSLAGDSYLRIDKIIAAAKSAGADAIHPGYGFLSENAAFATACADAGIVFIGPPADAMAVMGDKAKAKRAMIAAGVPCVPGYLGMDQSEETLVAEADRIGYPVMVKAAAGGGGRGMRLVQRAGDMPSAIRLARSESEAAFGSGDLILEEAIARPRHVEIQVVADAHGAVIHLGERDCSIQRRHQKVIEEAPCPAMTPALRDAMGSAAVAAARAVGYRGVGTVEFLLDESGRFFFLEMNTRLQVEHPVTEEITGIDLVALQIEIARLDPLALAQEDVTFSGYAIEARLYAEDPASDFMPASGPVLLWTPPAGMGIRVESGIVSGSTISPFYDALAAKIIAHGATRDEARRRLIAALGNTALFGVPTNREFLISTLTAEVFAAGHATTAFVLENRGHIDTAQATAPLVRAAPAIAIQQARSRRRSIAAAVAVDAELLDWSSTQDLRHAASYDVGGLVHTVCVTRRPDGYRIESPADTVMCNIHALLETSCVLDVDTVQQTVHYFDDGAGTIYISSCEGQTVVRNVSAGLEARDKVSASGVVTAPMHGRLVEISVAVGQAVKRGDTIAILEAMKMQHEIIAEVEGTVAAIIAARGEQVAANDTVLEIEPSAGDDPR